MERELVYRHEKSLSVISLVLGVVFWIAIIVGTIGIALAYVLLFFLLYLFAQSAFISHIKGTAVRLSSAQLPDLYERYQQCCAKLHIENPPDIYLLHGDGVFNAFATRFLGRNFVVLLSDVVDALDDLPDGVNFYIGHELGHIRMKHLTGHIWRTPSLWLPLLGAAYSRAKESTCDLHGLACCTSPENASRAMAALAAGTKRWSTMNLDDYAAQAKHKPGFWMSYHELCSSYPWLNKRLSRVYGTDDQLARRSGSAYLLAIITPNIGNVGGSAGPLVFIAMIGILAAIAFPAYQQYTTKAKLSADYAAAVPITSLLTDYYVAHKAIPESLPSADAPKQLSTGAALELDSHNMSLHVSRKEGGFVLTPRINDQHQVEWGCAADAGTAVPALPKACRP